MLGGLKGWFTALSTTAKVGVVSAVVITGGVVSSTAQQNNQSPPPQVKAQTSVCTPTKSDITETQSVPFEKTTVNDPNTSQGKTYIQTAGVNGVKTLTYENTTYSPSGCLPGSKTLTKTEVTTAPISEVTAVGTYVAPTPVCANGSYTNVDGITVCSPSNNPSGATARCVDGSYSYSLNHSGTCSHHGGVAEWL
jgi:resuscitation-promoting factor RpfB